MPVFREQAQRAGRGRRRRADPRDLPGHARDEGADPRRAREAFGARRAARADPVLGHARSHRPHAARHRHPRRARHARGDAGRDHRAQLLDRARSHARRDPLPVAEREHADPLHPQRRAADQRRRPRALPDEARADGGDAARVRRRAWASTSSAAAAARRPSTSARWSRRSARRAPAPRPGRERLVRVERHDRDRAAPGAARRC